MASAALESVIHPFTAFNFVVEIVRDDAATPLVSAAFAECDGLEMTQDIRTVREGGNNATQIRLAGPASFGQITLRRGMTGNFDLWAWFSDSLRDPSLRADASVVILAADRQREYARFLLGRCLPLRLKAPTLNARDGIVAVEELRILCETLTLQRSD